MVNLHQSVSNKAPTNYTMLSLIKTTLTMGCLFSGMGGFCGGFKKAGIKTIWANDIDENACASFQENYPDVRMLKGGIDDLSVTKDAIEPVDILTAGFPCQSFSQAGMKLGFDDERGKLFFQIIRLIEEFGDAKPKIILLENVPYLASGGAGRWLHEIITNVQKAGYWFDKTNCCILKTDEISELPQGRERLFMLATSVDHFFCNDFIFPQPANKTRPLADFINKSKKQEKNTYLSPDNRFYKEIEKKIKKGSPDSIYQLRRYYVREYSDKCPTLTANMGGGGHNIPFIRDKWGIRPLSVDECARLQGFDNYVFPAEVSMSNRYKQIGNAVSLPIAERLGEACLQFYQSDSRQKTFN